MKNYIQGRPYTEQESDVLLLKMSGAVVGELNHERKYPVAFRTKFCDVVQKKVEKVSANITERQAFFHQCVCQQTKVHINMAHISF